MTHRSFSTAGEATPVQRAAKNHSAPRRCEACHRHGGVHIQDLFVLWTSTSRPGKVQGLPLSVVRGRHGQGRKRSSKHPDKELCREPPDSYVEGTSLRNAPFWLWGLPLSSFLLAFRNYSAAEARLIQFQGDGGRSRVTGLSYSTWTYPISPRYISREACRGC